MRILDKDVQNQLDLSDALSGGRIGLLYRMPTTKENSGYSNGMVVRRGNKMERNLGQVRQTYGAAILTGIVDYQSDGKTEHSFGKLVNGQPVGISSNPASPNYDPNWKELVVKQAPDCIEILAIQVFEASVSKAQVEDEEPEQVEDETAGE